jgi:hypothetical protein
LLLLEGPEDLTQDTERSLEHLSLVGRGVRVKPGFGGGSVGLVLIH